MKEKNNNQIGLALSGGGFRAVAFHLGCLRALNSLDILKDVKVISTVSGGSLVGSMYQMEKGTFEEFDKRVLNLLEKGLTKPFIKTCLHTSSGIEVVVCLASLLVNNISRALFNSGAQNTDIRLRRFASRTTVLQEALETELFRGELLSNLKSEKPLLIINATELQTGAAFYFSPKDSGSWRFGRVTDKDIPLSLAVVSSAAYPLLLPAIEQDFLFENDSGGIEIKRVVLSDGGVYDNLGLSPLWPDRDPNISLNASDLDSIICCRAGYGLRYGDTKPFVASRLFSSFETMHSRIQNSGIKRLFDLKDNGIIKNVVLPFLDQRDNLIEEFPPDFISREEVSAYPTNFKPMSQEWINKLTKRGEQLTTAMVLQHAPQLLR